MFSWQLLWLDAGNNLSGFTSQHARMHAIHLNVFCNATLAARAESSEHLF